MSDLTKPEHVPSCVSTGEGVTVPAPTPRTDAEPILDAGYTLVSRDFARTLERELTEARATLLAREGELDSMSAALAAKDVELAMANDAAAKGTKARDIADALTQQLAAAKATAREAMEEADHYKRIFKSNGASMELMASRIPTGGQVIDAVIRAAAVTADSPGVLVWSANAAEQIEAALAKIAEEGQAQP